MNEGTIGAGDGPQHLADPPGMDDACGWTWSFRVVRPAVELFAIATVLLALAGALPALVIAAAVMEYRDEASRAAAAPPELLAGEQQSATIVVGLGAVLALTIAIVGCRLVQRLARGSSDVASPRPVAAAAIISSAAIVAGFFAWASESRLAGSFVAGAALLVITSLATVAAAQISARLRTA